MIPELFTIGPLTVNSFGAMAVLSFVVPMLLMRRDLPRFDLDPDLANALVFSALIGGVLGARIYFLAERWDRFLANPSDFSLLGAGLVWYGGLAGGTLGVAIYVFRKGLPPFAIAENATASCNGVTRSKPCPIEADTVSPFIHGSLKRRSFHSLVGIKPGISWGMEMRLRLPRLKPKA